MALPSTHTSLWKSYEKLELNPTEKIPIKKPTACPGFNGHAGAPQPQRDQLLKGDLMSACDFSETCFILQAVVFALP